MTPWTVTHQAPLSLSQSGLPFPSPGDFPDPGIELASPASASGFFTTEPPGKPTTYKCRDDCFFEVEVIIIIRGRDKESKTERNCDDTEVILSK